MRQGILAVLSFPGGGTLLGQPQEANTQVSGQRGVWPIQQVRGPSLGQP